MIIKLLFLAKSFKELKQISYYPHKWFQRNCTCFVFLSCIVVRLRNEGTKSSLQCNTARSQLNYKSIQIEKLFLTDVSKSWHSINLPLHIWEWTKFSTKAPPVPVGWDPKICYALSNFNNAASSLPNSIPLQLPLLITHNSVWRHFNYFKTAQIDEAFLRQKCYALWQKNLNPLSLILFLPHAS